MKKRLYIVHFNNIMTEYKEEDYKPGTLERMMERLENGAEYVRVDYKCGTSELISKTIIQTMKLVCIED